MPNLLGELKSSCICETPSAVCPHTVGRLAMTDKTVMAVILVLRVIKTLLLLSCKLETYVSPKLGQTASGKQGNHRKPQSDPNFYLTAVDAG